MNKIIFYLIRNALFHRKVRFCKTPTTWILVKSLLIYPKSPSKIFDPEHFPLSWKFEFNVFLVDFLPEYLNLNLTLYPLEYGWDTPFLFPPFHSAISWHVLSECKFIFISAKAKLNKEGHLICSKSNKTTMNFKAKYKFKT